MTDTESSLSSHASKVDAWLVLVTALTVATSAIAAVVMIREGGVPAVVMVPVTLVLGAGLPLWVLLGTRYELTPGRLRIDYGRGSSVMISPRDKARFLEEIGRYRATARLSGAS